MVSKWRLVLCSSCFVVAVCTCPALNPSALVLNYYSFLPVQRDLTPFFLWCICHTFVAEFVAHQVSYIHVKCKCMNIHVISIRLNLIANGKCNHSPSSQKPETVKSDILNTLSIYLIRIINFSEKRYKH